MLDETNERLIIKYVPHLNCITAKYITYEIYDIVAIEKQYNEKIFLNQWNRKFCYRSSTISLFQSL